MVRTPSRDKSGLKKGTWTPEEDAKLIAYITRYGCWNWRQLPRFAGLERCGKSCRLRWMNYLRPDIKRGNFTQQEDDLIIRLHSKLGNRWSTIAADLPGRTDNEVKNHWHTNLKKHFPEKSERNEKSKSKVSKPNPAESEQGTGSVSNKSILQSTPATSHNSNSCPMSPLSSSSGFSGISTDTSAHSNENLFPEDDLAFLNSYTETMSSDFWIDDTYAADISFVPSETMLESAAPLQSRISSSSSESFVMDNDFAFVDADTEPIIENFWSEAYMPAASYIINPTEAVTPSPTETELFSSVYGVDAEFWKLNNLCQESIGLF